jgi:hypothetical protein
VAGSRVHSHSGSQTHLRILAACSPELCFVVSPSIERGRREDRVPAGTRGPLCEIVVTRLHSGIQVKPNIRPSLRGGFTAYVALSPGSDALLPPSPCGWLTRAPGWAAHITATLDAQTPGARTTRFRRTPITPVVCARPSPTVARPCEAVRADVTNVHRRPARVRDDRDTPLFLGPE